MFRLTELFAILMSVINLNVCSNCLDNVGKTETCCRKIYLLTYPSTYLLNYLLSYVPTY